MMQSFAAEQAARADINVSHFDELRGLVINIATAVNASAQSAAASANRLDGAMAKVVSGNVDVTAAAAAIKAAVPHLYGSAHRPSKRAKKLASSCGQARAGGRGLGGPTANGDSDDADTGDGRVGGSATAVATAPVLGAADKFKTTYYHAVVHDMTIPVEMVTDTLDTEPLFDQLDKMLRLCHVTAGHQGLFGSLVVHGMYLAGVKKTEDVRNRGGAAATINAAKTVRMKNIIKNKVHLYLRQMCWMHSVVPHLLKPPQEASFDVMSSAEVGQHEREALALALRGIADEFVLPPNHPLRNPIRATASILRNQLNKMSGRPGTPSLIATLLASSPFRELLAEAENNVKARYQ